jgi:general secretion pathway protein L
MRRKHIALKPATDQWAFAVASGDATEATLLKTGFFVRDPGRTLAEQLGEIIGPLQMTDRLACTLPAKGALLRWLEFPFNEPRKVAAAVLPELACQIPETLEKRSIFHEMQSTGKILAAAVLNEPIEELLSQFDDNREPLGFLGLAPFCYISGLDWPVDSLLLCVEEDEISLSRIENSAVADLRILPRTTQIEDSGVVQQAMLLSRCGTGSIQRLRLLGIVTDSSLASSLEQAGFEIEPILLSSKEGRISEELTTVASLALAATKAGSSGLNLRSGPYKLTNDWQALKRRAWLAAGLILLTVLIASGSGYLQYRERAKELKNIQQQMAAIYQKQFPGEKLRIAAPLQLQSKLKELQKKAAQFGTDAPGALQVLLAVSKSIDTDVSVDIREYGQSDEGLRLAGSTTSFDAVSRLLASLQKEPLFPEVRILDSKQAIDGSRVDFQLQIQLKQIKGE